jgi:hypothetical protein
LTDTQPPDPSDALFGAEQFPRVVFKTWYDLAPLEEQADMVAEPAKARDVSSVVGLDLRSLGLLRIALGWVLLLDWLARGFHFRAHYTDQGILPLRTYLNQPDLSYRFWSVFYINDSPWFVGALFAVGLLGSLALMLGYRTAWSGWIVWVLLLGLHHRNPLVLHKGDTYLLLLLFWGNFLPWGRFFSVDGATQVKGSDDQKEQLNVSLAGTCYLAQICLLYWFTALLRTHPAWQVDGSALYFSFNLDALAKEPAYLGLSLGPEGLAFFTFAALWWEFSVPFVLLLPWAWTRILGVASIVLFHAGIYLTLDIINFAWICMVAPLGLLPTKIWQLSAGRFLERSLSGTAARVQEMFPQRWLAFQPPLPGPRWARLGQLLPALALLAAVAYLWADLSGYHQKSLALKMVRVAGMDQRWGMFSPRPPSVHGWQSVEARRKSGVVFDLITEKPYPPGQYSCPRTWSGQRWTQYRNMLLVNGFPAHVDVYLRYLVSAWNRAHPDDPVVAADYVWHSRYAPPDYLLYQRSKVVVAQYRP